MDQQTHEMKNQVSKEKIALLLYHNNQEGIENKSHYRVRHEKGRHHYKPNRFKTNNIRKEQTISTTRYSAHIRRQRKVYFKNITSV